MGADAIRWYFYINSAPWLPNRFHDKAVTEGQRKFMGTLWNTYAFFVLYANIDEFDASKYSLEYGTAEIEAHVADITKDKRILLVDDLIATGGTLAAARNLVEQGGASVAGVFGVIGLPFLNYERVLSPIKATTLVNYNSESM